MITRWGMSTQVRNSTGSMKLGVLLVATSLILVERHTAAQPTRVECVTVAGSTLAAVSAMAKPGKDPTPRRHDHSDGLG